MPFRCWNFGLDEAFRRFAVRCVSALPKGLAYGISLQLPFRIHTEVPQTCVAWGGGETFAGVDQGNLPQT